MKKTYIPKRISEFMMLDVEINECTSEEFNELYPLWSESINGKYKSLPDKLFLLHEHGKFVGIDNRTYDAFTEEFDSRQECINWLIDEVDIL